MQRTTVNVGLAICLFFLSQVLSVNSGTIRRRRNSLDYAGDRKSIQHERYVATGDAVSRSCTSVLKHCKRNNRCREIFKDLKTKCAVKQGSCNAEMGDLSACANTMDRILDFFDFEQKCFCEQKSRCLRIYNTIYDNPCFASVKFLRKKNLMPQATRENSNPNRDGEQYLNMSSSHDFIQELIESVSVEPDDDVINKQTPTTVEPDHFENPEPEPDMINEQVQDLKDEPSSPFLMLSKSENPTSELEPKPSQQQNRQNTNSNSVLLYIIVGVVGILVVVLLVVGFGLLLYCGLWRKGRSTTKTASSK